MNREFRMESFVKSLNYHQKQKQILKLQLYTNQVHIWSCKHWKDFHILHLFSLI